MKYKRRKHAYQQLKKLNEMGQNVLFIHYSSESFYERENGTTPRITSIAIRNFESGQTHSFSIHEVAEIQKVSLDSIDNEYDKLEKNNISAHDFLPGQDEAEGFNNKEYMRIHQSTLRKVDIFSNIATLVIDKNLRTNSKWYVQ